MTLKFFILGFGVLLSSVAPGLAQDEAKVKAGMEVWKTAGCAECHGSFADGEKQRDEAPSGANLRRMRLDDAAVAEIIRFPAQWDPKLGIHVT